MATFHQARLSEVVHQHAEPIEHCDGQQGPFAFVLLASFNHVKVLPAMHWCVWCSGPRQGALTASGSCRVHDSQMGWANNSLSGWLSQLSHSQPSSVRIHGPWRGRAADCCSTFKQPAQITSDLPWVEPNWWCLTISRHDGTACRGPHS